MTAETDLLPLPEPKGDVAGGGLDWTDEEMQSYARANVEASTEALREQVSRLDGVNVELGRQLVEHEDRAERLAEALDAVVTFAVCYQLSEGDQCVVDARALLRPTAAQEDGQPRTKWRCSFCTGVYYLPSPNGRFCCDAQARHHAKATDEDAGDGR